MDRVRDNGECAQASVRELECAVCKRYKANTARIRPLFEIKASPCAPLRLRANGAARLKLTHMVRGENRRRGGCHRSDK